MSDLFYNVIWGIAFPAFWTSSTPVAIGAEHTRRPGAYILAAANHQSPYDIPLLMRHCARNIDFVSITEVFQHPFIRWFYGSMNAFPLDRSHPDTIAVRTILQRLQRGRVVGIFPDGRFRRRDDSVLYTHRIQPGVGRIARLANVPVVPCVILNSMVYSRFSSWLPLRQTHYAIAFGPAMQPLDDAQAFETALVEEFLRLRTQLPQRV